MLTLFLKVFLTAISLREAVSSVCNETSDCSCANRFVKVGCFKDNRRSRSLPHLMFTDRDKRSPFFSGQRVDWMNWENYVTDIVKRCGDKASRAGYKYFGIQYYGECWGGSDGSFSRYGPTDECIDGYWNKPCNDSDKRTGCVGKANANYVYKLNEKEKLVDVNLEKGDYFLYQLAYKMETSGGNLTETKESESVVTHFSLHVINTTCEAYWFLTQLSFRNVIEYFLVRLTFAPQGDTPEDNRQIFGEASTDSDLVRHVQNILSQVLPSLEKDMYSKIQDPDNNIHIQNPGKEKSKLVTGSGVDAHREAVITDSEIVISSGFNQSDIDDFDNYNISENDQTILNRTTGVVNHGILTILQKIPLIDTAEPLPQGMELEHGVESEIDISIVNEIELVESRVDEPVVQDVVQKLKNDCIPLVVSEWTFVPLLSPSYSSSKHSSSTSESFSRTMSISTTAPTTTSFVLSTQVIVTTRSKARSPTFRTPLVTTAANSISTTAPTTTSFVLSSQVIVTTSLKVSSPTLHTLVTPATTIPGTSKVSIPCSIIKKPGILEGNSFTLFNRKMMGEKAKASLEFKISDPLVLSLTGSIGDLKLTFIKLKKTIKELEEDDNDNGEKDKKFWDKLLPKEKEIFCVFVKVAWFCIDITVSLNLDQKISVGEKCDPDLVFDLTYEPFVNLQLKVAGSLSIFVLRAGIQGQGTFLQLGWPLTLRLRKDQWCFLTKFVFTPLQLNAQLFYQLRKWNWDWDDRKVFADYSIYKSKAYDFWKSDTCKKRKRRYNELPIEKTGITLWE